MTKRALTYSLILHGALLLLVIFGLPSFFHKPVPQHSAISVELLPMSEISNVKKRAVQHKKQPPKPPVPSKPVPSKPVEQSQPKPAPVPDKTPDVPPPPPPKPQAEKKPTPPPPKPKPKPEKKQPPKKSKESSELDDALKNLETPNDSKDKDAKKPKKDQEEDLPDVEENTKSDSDQYNDAAPLAMNEQDMIRSQVEKHWSVPAGAKDAGKMQVVLRVKLAEDGSVTSVTIEKSSSEFGADSSVARAFDESCRRAVEMSSPFQNMPADKYDSWKDFTFTFTPEGL